MIFFFFWQKLSVYPFGFYVGVAASGRNIVTNLIGLTLAWLTGDIVDAENHTCTDKHSDTVNHPPILKQTPQFYNKNFSYSAISKCPKAWKT